ncbi:MAG: MFS transporter [Bacillota bacterium]
MSGHTQPAWPKSLICGEFGKVWASQAVSLTGDWIYYVALILHVLKLTGSAFTLGKLLIFSALPVAVCSPLAGVLVDRVNRKYIMVTVDVARAALVALVPYTVSIGQIYVLTMGLAALGVFYSAARGAVVPKLVPPEALFAANSLSALTLGVARVLGSALGGILIGLRGPHTAFLVNSGTFLCSACLIACTAIPANNGHSSAVRSKELWRDLISGYAYIKDSPVVLFLAMLIGLALMAAGAGTIGFPVLIRDELGAGAGSLGSIMAAMGAGAFVGSALSARYGARFEPRRVAVVILACLGVLAMAIPYLRVVGCVAILVAMFGLGNTAISITFESTVQRLVPDAMLGKVFAAYTMLVQVTNLLSMGSAGYFIDRFGAKLVIFAAGAFIFACSSLAGILGKLWTNAG